jgi:hypothetical protein
VRRKHKKVEDKLLLCLRRVGVTELIILNDFYISVLDGCASMLWLPLAALPQRKDVALFPVTDGIESCLVGPRAGLDVITNRKVPERSGNLMLPLQAISNHFTDGAIPANNFIKLFAFIYFPFLCFVPLSF